MRKHSIWNPADSLAWFAFLVLLFCFAVLGCAHGQLMPYISPSGVTFPLQDPPQPVASASVARLGQPGMRTMNYWIVANSLAGQSSLAGPFTISQAANVYGSGNGASLQWTPVSTAVRYDLLRSDKTPQGACNCAVATGLTATSYNDTSESRSAYTVAPLNSAGLTILLNNIATGIDTSCLAANGLCLATSADESYQTIEVNGTPLPQEPILNLVGVAGADDPTNHRSVITTYYQTVQNAGAAEPQESATDFIGFSVADDPTNHRTTVTLPTLLQTQILSPAAGNYAVIYPTTYSQYTGSVEGTVTANLAGALINRTASSTINTSYDLWANWTGFSLPAYIPAANVTAVYLVGVSTTNDALGIHEFYAGQGTPTYNAGVTYSGGTIAYIPSAGNGQQSVVLASGAPAASFNFAGVNLTADNSSSAPGSGNDYWNIGAVALVVIYSGGAQQPQSTGVQVAPPLTLNAATDTLSIPQASASTDGYLSHTDWLTFNSATTRGIDQYMSVTGCEANTTCYSPSSGVTNWPTAFADTSYFVTCTPIGFVNSGAFWYVYTKTAAGIAIVTTVLGANNPGGYVSFDCYGHHN